MSPAAKREKMDIVIWMALLVSFVLTLVIGRFLIPELRKMKAGQSIREDGPSWHAGKAGTPTMRCRGRDYHLQRSPGAGDCGPAEFSGHLRRRGRGGGQLYRHGAGRAAAARMYLSGDPRPHCRRHLPVRGGLCRREYLCPGRRGAPSGDRYRRTAGGGV